MSDSLYNGSWLCIRLYTIKPYEIKSFLETDGIKVFLPEEYRVKEDADGHRKRSLVPVVRNLLFVYVDNNFDDIRQKVGDSRYHTAFITPSPAVKNPAKISDVEMQEFIQMCNPDIENKQFVTHDEVKLKNGDMVIVERGPLKGITGRLIRKAKKYYLLKEAGPMAVLLKVTKWTCRKIE